MTPAIELDTTLADLYALNMRDNEKICLSYVGPTTEAQLIPGFPLCKKFVYQDRLIGPDGGSLDARIQTQFLPQWHGFIAGNMETILFDLDLPSGGELAKRARADGEELRNQFAKSQRPVPIYVKHAADITLPPGTAVAVGIPSDCLEHLPTAVPFEGHYRALSKRDLALSDVPSPPSEVIDTILDVDEVQDDQARNAETTRMLKVVEEKSLPFVVKLPQSHAGLGTFFVRTEGERTEALAILRVEVSKMLRSLNSSNKHLQPVSLIIQEMIEGETIAVSLFLHKSGDITFTACTDQSTDSQGHWSGSHIDYSQQAHLMATYKDITNKMCGFLSRLGYYGPVGADIITTPDGSHSVIDVNARVAGSHPLGFLKSYFSVARGFNDAIALAPVLNISLADFKTKFSKELEEGRLIIISWCQGEENEPSLAGALVAGEDKERMAELAERIKALGIASAF